MRVGALLLLAVGAEGAMAFEAWGHAALDVPTAAYLVATHVVAAVLAAEALRARLPAAGYPLGLLLCGPFPVFGVLGCVWLAAWPPRAAERSAESPEAVRARASEAVRAAARAEQESGADVEAVAEALHDPDLALSLGAVEALRGAWDVEAVRLLGEAKRSERPEVRARAVEVLGQLGQAHADAVAAAESVVRRAPDDPAAHAALASCHARYHALEAEDPVVQAVLLRNAARHFFRATQLGAGAGDRDARLGLAVALEGAGNLEDAARILDPLFAEDPRDPAVLLARARLRFRAGDLVGLRATARQALWNDDGALPPRSRRALELWAG